MRNLSHFITGLCLLTSVTVAMSEFSLAQDTESSRTTEIQGYLLSADSMIYDDATRTMTAEGNVEVASDTRILLADRVTYNLDADRITAEGNVSLLEPTGEVLFADRVAITNDLRDGFLEGLRVLLADDSKFAARLGRRTGGNITELIDAAYSPCEVCKDNPEEEPLWQISASKIIHDQETHTISYTNPRLEVYGVPIFYLPYLSHPDPSVENRTGFLTPEFGTSTELGLTFELPYHIALKPWRDLTLTPMLTTDEGPVLTAQFRERRRTGQLQVNGSITRPRTRDDENNLIGGHDWRGHIFSKGEFQTSAMSRWGFQLERSTDDTYLRRYGFSDEKSLMSRLFTESYRGRVQGSAEILFFQGLRREDRAGETPFLFPYLNYRYESEPRINGSQWSVAANGMVLTRTDGTDSRRLSIDADWRRPFYTLSGHIMDVTAGVRGDIYHLDDVLLPDNSLATGFQARVLPYVAASWRYPLIKNVGKAYQVFEPILTLIATPNGGNPDKIPNEDSLSFEFSDSNIFAMNRFAGLDEWEGGTRINYGFKWGLHGSQGGFAGVMLGQSYRFEKGDVFAAGTGLEDNLSDIVGRLQFNPVPQVSVVHRFRIDHDSFAFRRNQVDVTYSTNKLFLNVEFVDLPEEQTDANITERREIGAAARWQINDNWSINAGGRRNLIGNGHTVDTRFGVFYEDECIELGVTYDRQFSEDRDVEPSTSVIFRISLKHFGDTI